MNVICHVDCHVHIYGILPKTFIKTFGAIFQPLLSLWSGQSTSKGGHQSFLGKSLPSQVRKRIGTNQTYLESLHKSWVSLGSLGPFQPAER